MSEEGLEQKYIQEAFDTNWVVPLGPNVNAFESALKDFHGGKYEAVALSVENLGRDMPLLAEFLKQTFHGGTDIWPALNEASRIINGNDYKDSDIVLISDFEIPPMNHTLAEKVQMMKLRKTSFFGLIFGNQPESEYLKICDRYWEM